MFTKSNWCQFPLKSAIKIDKIILWAARIWYAFSLVYLHKPITEAPKVIVKPRKLEASSHFILIEANFSKLKNSRVLFCHWC